MLAEIHLLRSARELLALRAIPIQYQTSGKHTCVIIPRWLPHFLNILAGEVLFNDNHPCMWVKFGLLLQALDKETMSQAGKVALCARSKVARLLDGAAIQRSNNDHTTRRQQVLDEGVVCDVSQTLTSEKKPIDLLLQTCTTV